MAFANEDQAVGYLYTIFGISVYKMALSVDSRIEFDVNGINTVYEMETLEDLEVAVKAGTRAFKVQPVRSENPNGFVIGWNFARNRRCYINWRRDGRTKIGLMEFPGDVF